MPDPASGIFDLTNIGNHHAVTVETSEKKGLLNQFHISTYNEY